MSRKKKRKKGGSQSALHNRILAIFRANAEHPLPYKTVIKRCANHGSKDEIFSAIQDLIARGKIEHASSNRLRIAGKHKASVQYTGTVDLTAAGSAYILVDELDQDIYVPSAKTMGAMNGDTVRVAMRYKTKRGRPEGVVLQVIKRDRSEFIGNLELTGDFAFVVPLNKKGQRDIFIPSDNLKKGVSAKDGDRVRVKIVKWPSQAKNPVGQIVEVLGRPGEHDTEMRSILEAADFPIQFPQAVIDESQAIENSISEDEIGRRHDMRSIDTFTIDPVDARDFDDAISIKKIADDGWEIGIHIADVSHYVTEGSALDKEAYERATSVYLVDRVNPMLPEYLSNGLCSLRPDEDKLCYSAIFNLTKTGNIKKEWFGKTVIRSNRRFTYDEVQQILIDEKGEFHDELKLLNGIATSLRKARVDKGALVFESDELRFQLDINGKPIAIHLQEHNESHMLVEDFMLLANKRVAEFVGRQQGKGAVIPFVYRVHDHPDLERLRDFETLVRDYGYDFKLGDIHELPKTLNNFMREIEGTPEQGMLNKMAIRCMSKAIYTTDNIGHFGLAFPAYTHFTSPIRRYPDIMVHRLLSRILNGDKYGASKTELEKNCGHCSKRERQAMKAEYESIEYKQAEYMLDKTGMEFEGVISGITSWGIFVILNENKCEGMIRLDSIGREFYYDKRSSSIHSIDRNKKFRIGDPIHIKLESASLEKRELEFSLLQTPSNLKLNV